MGSEHKSIYQLDLLVWWRLGGRTMTPSPSLNGAATEKYAVVSDRMQSPLWMIRPNYPRVGREGRQSPKVPYFRSKTRATRTRHTSQTSQITQTCLPV